jgi:hypothetical protein
MKNDNKSWQTIAAAFVWNCSFAFQPAMALNNCSGGVARFAYRDLQLVKKVGSDDVGGFTIDMDRMVYWRGYSGLRLKICDPSDKMICFTSSAVSFAVPKIKPSIGASWTSNGNVFNVLREENLSLLGHRLSLLVIGSDKENAMFLYSMQHGLLAVSFRDGSLDKEEFWSESLYGFPFSTCKDE